MPINRFINEKQKHWYTHFKKNEFDKMKKRQKKFGYQIVSDGVAASVLFENKNRQLVHSSDESEIKEKYIENQYKNQCGIDLGYKLWIACVKKDQETG